MCPSESAIALDPVRDPHLIAGGHMDLAHLPTVGGTEDLGFVKLPTSTLAARVAADARPGTEAASDQRSALSDEKLKLLVKLVLSLEEAAGIMGKPCICGIFNPCKSVNIIHLT